MPSRPFCALNGKHARIGALLLLSGCAIAGTQNNTIPRPNILFILADDVGIEALGCYGGTTYSTPHLDELASSGIRFRHAYSMPVCHPSRVAILLGRYPSRFNAGWGEFPKSEEGRTVARLLRSADSFEVFGQALV